MTGEVAVAFLLAVLLAAVACDEVDEFSMDCANPFSLDGCSGRCPGEVSRRLRRGLAHRS